VRPPEAEFDQLTAEDVSRHFGRRRALSRVSFRAERGAILGLLGPNGAGKSTMLALLGTLLRPSTGRILYGTHDALHHGASLRACIGVLGHDMFLYPELTARENLEFFAGLYGVHDRRVAAVEALDHAGLADRADEAVTSFSRGMRQRLGLERALIHRPRLLLLDEPFTGLDDASAAALGRRLGTLRDQGAIIILATHDLDLAEPLLNRAIFLRDGRVVDTVERPEALRAVYRDVMSRSTAVSGFQPSPTRDSDAGFGGASGRTDEP
jgi:ABC-type multidrug transport system ATPase subunit